MTAFALTDNCAAAFAPVATYFQNALLHSGPADYYFAVHSGSVVSGPAAQAADFAAAERRQASRNYGSQNFDCGFRCHFHCRLPVEPALRLSNGFHLVSVPEFDFVHHGNYSGFDPAAARASARPSSVTVWCAAHRDFHSARQCVQYADG